MKKVRTGVFETNSSSTHSICIAKDAELIVPKNLHFCFGEFGWKHDTLYSLGAKSSYLYTGLMVNSRQDDFAMITKTLTKRGVCVTFEEATYSKSSYSEQMYLDNDGYMDHSDELKVFLDAICENENELMNFLFSGLSFIITGNDNCENDISINVDYPHTQHYKGN